MQNSSHKLRKIRIMWIDMARGFAMLSILLFHTDSYNFEQLLIPYGFYVENFLALFFFISGFLFYREETAFDFKHKIKSIFKTIVLPYFIFTTCMALPKAIVYGNELSTDMLITIICGQASWFVTSLVLAELLFSVLILIQKYSKFFMPSVCFICGITSVYFAPEFNFWHFHNTMLAMPFLYMGYMYHKHEIAVTWFFNNKVFITAASVLLIIMKYMEYTSDIRMLFEPVMVTSFLLFFVDTITFITLFILFIKHIRPFKMICWTGRNTLVYYFLCGGVPLLTNKLLDVTGVNYGNNIMVLLLLTIFVYIITTIITHLIVRYIPFVTGKF